MNKLFVVVIEDDPDDRDFISNALENYKNLDVRTFSRGGDFLNFIKTAASLPQLVITDIRMPVVTGHDVIRELKSNNKTADIPVVVLSTSGAETEIEKAKSLGAADYFVKPFSLKGYEEITSNITKKYSSLFSFTSIVDKFRRIIPGMVEFSTLHIALYRK